MLSAVATHFQVLGRPRQVQTPTSHIYTKEVTVVVPRSLSLTLTKSFLHSKIYFLGNGNKTYKCNRKDKNCRVGLGNEPRTTYTIGECSNTELTRPLHKIDSSLTLYQWPSWETLSTASSSACVFIANFK